MNILKFILGLMIGLLAIYLIAWIFLTRGRLADKVETIQNDGKRIINFYHDYGVAFPEVQKIESRLVHKSGMAYDIVHFHMTMENYQLFLNRIKNKGYQIGKISDSQESILTTVSDIFHFGNISFPGRGSNFYEIYQTNIYTTIIYLFSINDKDLLTGYMLISYN